MANAVDEWQDAHRHRNLGTLFQVAALITLHSQTGLSDLFLLLFQQVVKLAVFFLLTIHAVEEPQQEDQEQNSDEDRKNHPVELVDLMVEDACTGFELAVLACLFLQVDIDVSVIVTLGFVIDGRVSHRQLLTNTGHQVGSLIDERIRECSVQIVEGRIVVALGMVARCQRSVGARNLIDVAIGRKQL